MVVKRHPPLPDCRHQCALFRIFIRKVSCVTDSPKVIIDRLRSSCDCQAALYTKMLDVTQRIVSQLVLSKGDLLRVRQNFEEKQKLWDEIVARRQESEPDTAAWQEQKHVLSTQYDIQPLEASFDRMSRIIERYLSSEDQLKRYLEHLCDQGNKTAHGATHGT